MTDDDLPTITLSDSVDPATLRAVAAVMDEREQRYRGKAARGLPYNVAANVCQRLASDLRTQAIRIEQNGARNAAEC